MKPVLENLLRANHRVCSGVELLGFFAVLFLSFKVFGLNLSVIGNGFLLDSISVWLFRL